MKAMIFAAGLGSRLKPLTDSTPKALVPINGKPALEHVILKLKDAGFDDIVVNIHHFGEQIIDFLNANDYFGVNIRISDERKYLLDTGGGLKFAAHFLDGNEPFLVHNVDVVTNVDLREMYESHKPGTLATLLTSNRQTSRYLLFDNKNSLCGWRNKTTGEVKSHYRDFDPALYNEYAFGGVHVISPAIFNLMEEWTGKFSIIDFYLSVCGKNKISACLIPDITIIDIGSPESLARAERWMNGEE
jgi:NDP-sugar pyrophosphorylase family protein